MSQQIPPGERTANYCVIRSTRRFSQWFTEVARKTHRPKQDVLEMALLAYSEQHGNPAGPAPPRTYRFGTVSKHGGAA